MKTENESRQMYLKTIWELEKGSQKVRNIDIARALSYSKPSVTKAIKKLEADGLVISDKSRGISLTATGRDITEELVCRYNILYDFFLSIGAGSDTAKENACRMEHQITDELFAVIQNVLLYRDKQSCFSI